MSERASLDTSTVQHNKEAAMTGKNVGYRDGEHRRLREVYYNDKGVLKNIDEVDVSSLSHRRTRYEEGWAGNFKITIKLSEGHAASRRGINYFKILNVVNKKRIRPRKIMMLNFRSALM